MSLLALSPAWAADGGYSLLGDWPVKVVGESGIEAGLRGNWSYDYARFDEASFVDDDAWRRQELSAYVRKPGMFELALGYDFRNEVWLDNFVRISGAGGDLRIGQFKTPVGYEESAVGTAATTFMERAMPVTAFYAGRRLGVDWTYEKVPNWYFNLAVQAGGDLLGDNQGRTLGGRAVFNPIKDDTQVLHLGLSASNEKREDDTLRVQVRPEAFLTARRLVDSGALNRVEGISRYGLEAIWQRGPLLVQSEYLRIGVDRYGAPDYSADGYYLAASWVLTGEKRSYKSAAFGNLKPSRDWGAVELAARYSHIDLNDPGSAIGGRQSDWTFGANWYIGQHFKLQFNYVWADASRRGVELDPEIAQLRAQIYF
ncbi:OprO/OprP family phosphate-selective porin [Lysobacter enzymogenes]|uniref:OprO/OprP family phosphate-selective porin n=1 Tax=Lysobacter enzymogenes TaxID=69 RepID=UPI0019D02BE5|nr:porin [Lysobacter enzymogenes]